MEGREKSKPKPARRKKIKPFQSAENPEFFGTNNITRNGGRTATAPMCGITYNRAGKSGPTENKKNAEKTKTKRD